MKCKRFLSGLLFGIGCAFFFSALLAVLLASARNPHTQSLMDTFRAPTDSRIVSVVNEYMLFAAEQGWRVIVLGLAIIAAGAALLMYFSPRTPETAKPEHRPVRRPAAHTAATPVYTEPAVSLRDTEAPNPFAVSAYHECDTAARRPVSAVRLHAEPMLERNTYESQPADTAPAADAQPYFSARFASEAHAVATERSEASQSGSRILYRPEPLCVPVETPAPPPPAEEPAPVYAPAPSAALQPVRSVRIRSTMGRHTVKSPSVSLDKSSIDC